MKTTYEPLPREEWTSECHMTWKRRQRAEATFNKINDLVESLMDKGAHKAVESAKAIDEEGNLLYLV